MNKRKAISKKDRELVYEMYNGHCAYCFMFIFQTVDGKLHKLVWSELEDICNMFNFNFSMKIGRKYTKVELFDYDLLADTNI